MNSVTAMDRYFAHHKACSACFPAGPPIRDQAVLCPTATGLWAAYQRQIRIEASDPSDPGPSVYPLGGLDESGWDELV